MPVFSIYMGNPELVKALDYILNRCDETEIEIVSAAVVRRKRDLQMFAESGMPDPTKWAHETAAALSAESSGIGIDSVRSMVKNMVSEMLRKEAPELGEAELDELLNSWLPGKREEGAALPAEALFAMVDQFVAFSHGFMDEEEDAALRKQFDAWPERYWQAFPPVVRQVVGDYIEARCDEREFRSRLRAAVDLSACTGKGLQEAASKADEPAKAAPKKRGRPKASGTSGARKA